LDVQTCGQALLVNRVMSNVAEHVHRTAAHIDALYNSAMVRSLLQNERSACSVLLATAKSFEPTGTTTTKTTPAASTTWLWRRWGHWSRSTTASTRTRRSLHLWPSTSCGWGTTCVRHAEHALRRHPTGFVSCCSHRGSWHRAHDAARPTHVGFDQGHRRRQHSVHRAPARRARSCRAVGRPSTKAFHMQQGTRGVRRLHDGSGQAVLGHVQLCLCATVAALVHPRLLRTAEHDGGMCIQAPEPGRWNCRFAATRKCGFSTTWTFAWLLSEAYVAAPRSTKKTNLTRFNSAICHWPISVADRATRHNRQFTCTWCRVALPTSTSPPQAPQASTRFLHDTMRGLRSAHMARVNQRHRCNSKLRISGVVATYTP